MTKLVIRQVDLLKILHNIDPITIDNIAAELYPIIEHNRYLNYWAGYEHGERDMKINMESGNDVKGL